MKAQRWLWVTLLIISLMAFMVGGCGNNDIGDVTPDPNGDDNGETGDINGSDEFVPRVAVPDGLPVYPDAELWNDLTAGEEHWQWLYNTTGSGNDVVEFFVAALKELGFDINEDFTFAEREEFFITTADEIVRVYWLDSENLSEVDSVTADTPNRSYGIIVHQEGWAAR